MQDHEFAVYRDEMSLLGILGGQREVDRFLFLIASRLKFNNAKDIDTTNLDECVKYSGYYYLAAFVNLIEIIKHR